VLAVAVVLIIGMVIAVVIRGLRAMKRKKAKYEKIPLDDAYDEEPSDKVFEEKS